MSAYTLRLIVHYFVYPTDFMEGSPELRTKVLDELVEAEMLEYSGDVNPNYKLSERGKVYVEHLLQTPFPTKKWVME